MSGRSDIFRLALDMENRLNRIQKVIERAEIWCDKQLLPETEVCMAALKDIRRIMRKK